MRFRLPSIDQFSFWLGFITSALLWWLFTLVRPAFKQVVANNKSRRETHKEKARSSSAIDARHRQIVLQQAQGMHLAAPLFSLDEIILPPRLLTPPPRIEPGSTVLSEEIVQSTLPYLPDWPRLAAIYKAQTLSIFEALSGDSDIVLVGQTGMGKTVTLAYLASKIARKDPEPCFSQDLVPFLLHVADVDLPVDKDNPLFSVIEFVAAKASVLDLPRVPEFVRKTFSDGRALLLLDGPDELTPEGIMGIVEFIKVIKKVYPLTRIVTTASNDYLDGLVSLNFMPLAMAAWNNDLRKVFLQNWASKWLRFVSNEAWIQQDGETIDPLLLNEWIAKDSELFSPLDVTLMTWGVYAGDICGGKSIDALYSHIVRMLPGNTPIKALESLAIQINISGVPIFDPHRAREWIRSFEPADTSATNTEDELNPSDEKPRKSRSEKLHSPSIGLISSLVSSGLLSQHRNSRTRFSHPIFGGYLSGRGLVNYKLDAIMVQPPWIGKTLSLEYLALHGDISLIAEKLLAETDPPLQRNLITVSRWLRNAAPTSPWREKCMSQLLELMQQDGLPLGLRGQVVAAFCQLENESKISMMFRKMLENNSPDQQQLAALGVGALNDPKSVEILARLVTNPNTNVRQAVCLALAVISTEEAVNALADALLQGDDNQRRTAAEALAINGPQGYELLKEGASLKSDLLVRRAVAYGLGHIQEPWAERILSSLQTEDDQWVVRTAANEVIEEKNKSNRSIPKRLPPPTESPWIIAFAGKMGLGVAPDKPPTDLLLAALKSDVHEERLASLQYLSILPGDGVFSAIYEAMYGGDRDLREAAYYALSEIAARGIQIPDPAQL